MNEDQLVSLQKSIQSEQFAVRRLDPTRTNETLRHDFMGEMWENGKWIKVSHPIIRDRSLLNEIMKGIDSYVNSELRLATYTESEVRKAVFTYARSLNKMLFHWFDKWAKSKMPFVEKKGNIWFPIEDSKGNIILSREDTFVDMDGNTEFMIINKENKVIRNLKFKGKAKTFALSSYNTIILHCAEYVYGNLTRTIDGKESEVIGKNVQINEIRQIEPEKPRTGFLGLKR